MGLGWRGAMSSRPARSAAGRRTGRDLGAPGLARPACRDGCERGFGWVSGGGRARRAAGGGQRRCVARAPRTRESPPAAPPPARLPAARVAFASGVEPFTNPRSPARSAAHARARKNILMQALAARARPASASLRSSRGVRSFTVRAAAMAPAEGAARRGGPGAGGALRAWSWRRRTPHALWPPQGPPRTRAAARRPLPFGSAGGRAPAHCDRAAGPRRAGAGPTDACAPRRPCPARPAVLAAGSTRPPLGTAAAPTFITTWSCPYAQVGGRLGRCAATARATARARARSSPMPLPPSLPPPPSPSRSAPGSP
jgi:hypothetical protein